MHLRNSCTRSMSSWAIRQVPSAASGGRGLNSRIFFFTSKFQLTSVTRSLIRGNAFIGSMVTGLSSGRSLSRVMHISFGTPLISAEHEPHLPALQFQRTAKSLACSAWIWWTTSSTTMPSPTSALYSLKSPCPFSPRQIRNNAVDIICLTSFVFFDDLLEIVAQLLDRLAAQ